MFYRRKIILALMQLFEGELEKIRLQKLLFLFTCSTTFVMLLKRQGGMPLKLSTPN